VSGFPGPASRRAFFFMHRRQTVALTRDAGFLTAMPQIVSH
jgi:hypothetical protein